MDSIKVRTRTGVDLCRQVNKVHGNMRSRFYAPLALPACLSLYVGHLGFFEHMSGGAHGCRESCLTSEGHPQRYYCPLRLPR